MTRGPNRTRLLPFGIAAAALVACDFVANFVPGRVIAVCLQLIFALTTFVLLVRLRQREHQATQKVLKKISELGKEMKQEREAYRARSVLRSRKPLNPNGRN